MFLQMNEEKMEKEKIALKGPAELLLISCDGPVVMVH